MPRAVLLAALLVGASANGSAQPTLAPYEYVAQFKIGVPAGWETVEDHEMTRLLALSPPQGPEDRFRENVSVTFEGVPAGMDVLQYTERSLALLAASTTDLDIVASDGTTLGGRIARRSVYEHTFEGLRLRVLSYLVIVGRRAYVITATAPAETYERHVPVFEAIAASFQPR